MYSESDIDGAVAAGALTPAAADAFRDYIASARLAPAGSSKPSDSVSPANVRKRVVTR